MWSNYSEVAEELSHLEQYLKTTVKSRTPLLTGAVTSLIEAGGKRLRPTFVLLCAKIGRYKREKVLPTACAIEILHLATLVHDDIIDNAKTRRGIPTLHEKHRIDLAVYTGDFLFTKAVLLLSRSLPEDQLDRIAHSIKSICEGEVDQYNKKWDPEIGMLFYLKYIARKTAFLFAQSCALGAYLGKCSALELTKLARFGFAYGMAFQIRDDIRDILSTAEDSKKTVRSDLVNGVLTCPILFAMRRSETVRREISAITNNKEALSVEKANTALSLVVEHGGIVDAKNLLEKYIVRGMKALAPLPNTATKHILANLLQDLSD